MKNSNYVFFRSLWRFGDFWVQWWHFGGAQISATEPRNHKPWNDQQTTTKKPKNFNKIYTPTEPQTQKRPRNHDLSPTTTNLRLKEMRKVAAASIHPPIAIWITATQSLHTDLPSWFEAQKPICHHQTRPPIQLHHQNVNPEITDSTPPPKPQWSEEDIVWVLHVLPKKKEKKN